MKPGSYKVVVEGIGDFEGTKSAAFTLVDDGTTEPEYLPPAKTAGSSKATANPSNKPANNLTVKPAKKTYSVTAGKKTTLSAKKVFKVKKNATKGKVTYKKIKGPKAIKVSSNGKVTVKKNLKPGTYTVKVRVTSRETASYNSTSTIVSFKIKAK